MNQVFIGIGSNLGEREKNISTAIEKISKECIVKRKSSLYESEPIGFRRQPWFLNCAIEIETMKNRTKLFQFLKSIETLMGRENTRKNGPRLIDLDILFFNDEVIKERNLLIPHPRLHERRFVLEPMHELSPQWVHPLFKQTISELRSSLGKDQKIRKQGKIN